KVPFRASAREGSLTIRNIITFSPKPCWKGNCVLLRAFGLKGPARSPCLTIARIAEGREADQHQRPGRGLGNRGWADDGDREGVRVSARPPINDISAGRQAK